MIRRLTPLLAALLIVPAVATAATYTVDVPDELRSQIAKARERSGVRVLVPSRIETSLERVYADRADVRRGGYALALGRARDCNQATACFFAAFLADRGARTFGGRRVRLARGRTGYFTPSSCGASCAAPQVQWRERKVLYTIQAKVGTQDTERRRLVGLADQAIRAGAR